MCFFWFSVRCAVVFFASFCDVLIFTMCCLVFVCSRWAILFFSRDVVFFRVVFVVFRDVLFSLFFRCELMIFSAMS